MLFHCQVPGHIVAFLTELGDLVGFFRVQDELGIDFDSWVCLELEYKINICYAT